MLTTIWGTRRARPLLTALVLLLLLPLGLVAAGQAPARAATLTASRDAARTGWDDNEPGLTPSQVSAADFGQVFATQLDGQVYAQPLVVGSTVVATTEKATVYGLDAATGSVRWSTHLGSPYQSSTLGCGDLTPDLGSTSTPVVDPATGILYVTTKIADGPDATHPHWYLHALSSTTGQEQPGWPVAIGGAADNDPALTFDPNIEQQRAGLLLLGGVVYVGFGSHCDFGSWRGWVAGISITTHQRTALWSAQSLAAGAGGGIWQSGGGLVSDGAGRLFVSTGNGVSPPVGPGGSSSGPFAESVVRLQVGAGGTLSAADSFTPANATVLDRYDQDLGSGGPVALPPVFGSTSHPHVLLETGKDGTVYLLDRDALGGRAQGPGATDASLARLGPYNGIWGHPAAWAGEGGLVYQTENYGPLHAFQAGTTSAGVPTLTSAGTSPETYGYTSGSPVLTSTGTTTGSGVVWVVGSRGPDGSGGTLRAYAARPVNGVLQQLWSAPIGTAVKFSVPATDGGRVYVGTRDGRLLSFGRPASTPLLGSAADAGSAAVGSTVPGSVTLTASQPVTLTGVTTSGPFTTGTVALPQTLATGSTVQVPYSFTPSAPGPATGLMTLTTSAGSQTVALSGTGVAEGLVASPAQLAFGSVVSGGGTRTIAVRLTNYGSGTVTLQSVSPLAAPFSVDPLPVPAPTVAPGSSVTLPVTYTPAAGGSDATTLTVTSDAGAVTVPVSGTAIVGSKQLSLTPTTVTAGPVAVGSSATGGFDVGNAGTLPTTVTLAKAPAGTWATNQPLAEGLTLSPENVVHQPVTFTPVVAGETDARYIVGADDGAGARTVLLRGSATAPGWQPVPDPSAGGWVSSGAASTGGTTTTLAPAGSTAPGALTYRTALSTAQLHVTATLDGAGGTGGSVALLDASRTAPGGAAGSGSVPGLAPVPGLAVAMLTSAGGAQRLALVDQTNPAAPVEVASGVPSLGWTDGPHRVEVLVTGGRLTASLDGEKLIDQAVTLPSTAYLALTGNGSGTGSPATVSDVVATSVPTQTPPVLATSVPAPAAATWSLNGSASFSGGDLVLTPASPQLAGSSFFRTAVATDGLRAHFTEQISGGTGADGLTFALVDQASGSPSSLGGPGGSLGFGGLRGVAVSVDEYRNDGEPAGTFVGVLGATQAGAAPTYLATSNLAGSLVGGAHDIDVSVAAGRVRVAVDNRQLIDVAAPVPAAAWAGFTGGTGGLTNRHVVRNVAVAPPGTPLVATLPAVPGPGWKLNGSAAAVGADQQLTPARPGLAGSAVSTVPVQSNGLDATFTAQLGGGTGADGLALALVDPSAGTGALGANGGALGVGGLPATAVTLDTYRGAGEPSSNFVGVVQARRGTPALTLLASSTAVGALRTGTHLVHVTYTGGRLTVQVDGRTLLGVAVALPPQVLVAFTGGTGGAYDDHRVRGVRVVAAR